MNRTLQGLLIKVQNTVCIALFLLSSTSAYSQLQVTNAQTPPFTPENLVTNVFLGDGVEVLNVTYNGTPQAVGYFTGGLPSIGLERGIIMSSGSTATSGTAFGADGIGSQFANSDNQSTASDPDIASLATGTVFNLVKYTITFRPTADTVRFRYVFASEEYPEYACSSFNDIFGFFISGPGINGTFQNNGVNIAQIPGSTLPVTINNIHPLAGTQCNQPSFAQYYNDNNGSNNQPVYDGYLDVFTAEAVVVPCEVYTIKLVIADIGDSAFDSGVFLEAKSFGTGSLKVKAATVSLDGTITEGCSDGTLSFILPHVSNTDTPIDYNIIGTATNGVDYVYIPDNLTVPAGDTMISVPIIGLEDGITESAESIGIDIQRDPCNRDTFWIYLKDNLLVPPQLQDNTVICNGDSLSLDATLPIALPTPPSFTNTNDYVIAPTNSPIFSDINVFGVQPVDLGPGVIQSVCVNLTHNWDDDIDMFLISPGGQFIELSTDNGADGNNYTNTCFVPDPGATPINFPGPFAPATAAPFTGSFAPEGVWSDLWDSENPTNGTWRLQVIDDANGFTGTLRDWTITFNPIYKVTYAWSPTTGLSCPDCPTPVAHPGVTTTYHVTATDTYGCEVEDSITIVVNDQLPAPAATCGLITSNSITFEWPAVSGANSYEVNVEGSGWINANGILSHTITGLTLGDTITLYVRAVGNCEGAIDTITCNTPGCAPPVGNVVNVQDVSCNGGSNGSFTVSTTGIYPPYTFTLGSNTNSNGFFSGLPAATYYVIITGTDNCPAAVPVTISEPGGMVIQADVAAQVSCHGLADASAFVTVQGGAYPYAYQWNNNDLDSLANGLAVGYQHVTVTDNNGCMKTDSVQITEPTALQLNTTASAVSCNGSADGTATANISGGTIPYTYLWSPNAGSQVTATALSLSGASYTVTVTDFNGCTINSSILVNENLPVSLNTSFTQATCSGATDATATVIASGGNGSFTYHWSDPLGQATSVATGLTVGNYSVTVSDTNGCSTVSSVQVTSPNAIFVASVVDSTSCINTSDGSVMLNPSGGTLPYSYQWSVPGAATAGRSDLPGGNVTVTVTDHNNCFEVVSFVVPSPTAVTVALDSTLVSCFGGNNGTALATPTGGSGGYVFHWNNNQNTQIAANLSIGNYQVTVSDVYGCSAIGSVGVTGFPAIQLSAIPDSVTCFGTLTGSASANASGGAGGFSYHWNDSNNQSGANAVALGVGSYSVTASDANGCTAQTSVNVLQPSLLSTNVNVGSASCNGSADGTATVFPTGGTQPYSYHWSNNQNTQTASSLLAQNYYVTITDAHGCQALDTADINSPTAVAASMASTNVDCFGGSNGTLSVTVTGGSGFYTYVWNQTGLPGVPNQNNLVAGTYVVTVTDSNGCSQVASSTISQPAAMDLSSATVAVKCHGDNTGSIDLTVNGGAVPYQYHWSGPSNYLSLNQDNAFLYAGNYQVTVTDSHGCSKVTVATINQPQAISLSQQHTNVKCFAGSDGGIDLSVSGGTSGYTYLWTNSAGTQYATEDLSNLASDSYTVQVTDGNGCLASAIVTISQPPTALTVDMSPDDFICFNASDGHAKALASGGTSPYSYQWSSGANATDAFSLSAGTYSVTVTDTNNCSVQNTATIIQKEELQLSLSQTGAKCHDATDGTAQVTDIRYGATSASINSFSYHWNTNPAQTNPLANFLKGGSTYFVTATDADGCFAIGSIDIANPDAVLAHVDSLRNIDCFGGTTGFVAASGSGGTAPYTYLWSLNANSQTSNIATDLRAGLYFVTVQDANGCPAVVNAVLDQPRKMEASVSGMNILCLDGATGSMSVATDGGTGPYQFLWSNGKTTETIDSLHAGTYEVTVTDINGCNTAVSGSIIQPDSRVEATVSQTDVQCHDGQNGTITIEPYGGTPPYAYSLNGQDYNGISEIVGLTPGNYNVYIKDGNGCEFVSTHHVIHEPAPMEVDLGVDLTISYRDTVQLNAAVNGAQGAVSFSWSDEDSLSFWCNDGLCQNPFVSPAYQQVYSVLAEDENGCQAYDDITIFIENSPEVLVPTGFNPHGDPLNQFLHVHGKTGIQVKTFRIYDRWGELVYEALDFAVNDMTIGWNGIFRGKEMDPGIFVWYVESENPDGSKGFYKGQTTLIR